MANMSIFLSHWHSHINFYSQLSQFIRRCKDCYAFKNLWYLYIVLLRDITQNTADRNIANFSVLLLILKKVPEQGAFFFSSVWQLYFWDFIFEIWIENILKTKYYWEKGIPAPMMVEFPRSVISESWKIFKSLLVTISKDTIKLHNVPIQCSISHLKKYIQKLNIKI